MTIQRLTRRGFLAGLGSTLVASCALPREANRPDTFMAEKSASLQGPVIELELGYRRVNFTGVDRIATTVNGSLPAPLLRFREGDDAVIRVKNTLPVQSSIHWHGLILPAAMDGVPGLSFAGIPPGETFEYRFPLRQSGTYWYHSHSGFQEQTGVYGALVIDPADGSLDSFDRDYVVMLSDWSDEQPETIYARLKKKSHYYNRIERTLPEWFDEVQRDGLQNTLQNRHMWNRMRMSDRDLVDVSGYTYRYLINGHTPEAEWRASFNPGERIRLRFINAGAMSFFDVRIPGEKMTVVAADGQAVEPVTIDEFRIGSAETYDVIVEPTQTACRIFAQSMDRSGYATGVLSVDQNEAVAIPGMDPVPVLEHRDMGMSGVHANHGVAASSTSATETPSHDSHAEKESRHDHDKQQYAGQRHQNQQHHKHEHHKHEHHVANKKPVMGSGLPGLGSSRPVTHRSEEEGPHVDMRAENPVYRLDDPGPGLRDNGRRVLVYSDLKNRFPVLDQRMPDREIELHLTGNMRRYMWSFDGVPASEAKPVELEFGERVRFTLVNDTMMSHPIHLHGLWSELETGHHLAMPRKHTVVVLPGSKLSYLVTADAEGRWAYHCHLLYHMMGMFREVRVVKGGSNV